VDIIYKGGLGDKACVFENMEVWIGVFLKKLENIIVFISEKLLFSNNYLRFADF